MRQVSHVEVLQEQDHALVLKVHTRHSRYINEFIGLKCAPDLLALKLFPNAKEITESFSAWHAIKRYCGIELIKDRKVLAVDVACGTMPRTAALLAHLTPWSCHAVDPKVRADRTSLQRVRRLQCHQSTIQDFPVVHHGTVVMTAVHPHVKVKDLLGAVRAPRTVLVSIECCVPQRYREPPALEYQDQFCWSPKRTVRVWDIRGGAA